MERTRSEYRLKPLEPFALPPSQLDARRVEVGDRDRLALLVLDAYRGTVDDEGESLDDAFLAIDAWFAAIEWEHSFVLDRDGELIAASFVVVVEGVRYIDPVLTAPDHKGHGLGTAMVCRSLRSLAADDVREVGATITDGNEPSERLFARLGFVRVGAW
jgi:L-amino acid N-acyltransferase YncA